MTQYFVSPELNEKYDIKARPEKKNLDKRPPDLSRLLLPIGRPKQEDLESFQTNTTPLFDSREDLPMAPLPHQTHSTLLEAPNRQTHPATELQTYLSLRPASDARQEVKKEVPEAMDQTKPLPAAQRSPQEDKSEKTYKKNKLIRDLIETIEGVLLNTSKSVEEGKLDSPAGANSSQFKDRLNESSFRQSLEIKKLRQLNAKELFARIDKKLGGNRSRAERLAQKIEENLYSTKKLAGCFKSYEQSMKLLLGELEKPEFRESDVEEISKNQHNELELLLAALDRPTTLKL